jgi:hypothetical protein
VVVPQGLGAGRWLAHRNIIANGFGLLVDTPAVLTGADPDESLDDRREAARTRLAAMNAALWLPGEGSAVYHTTRRGVLDQMWPD